MTDPGGHDSRPTPPAEGLVVPATRLTPPTTTTPNPTGPPPTAPTRAPQSAAGRPSRAVRLESWWATARRALPWRETRDPWEVLVAEMMLTQTQVARVVPRYRPFLERFPDPASAVVAGPAPMLAAWVGLGYNRRAVQLHRAAMRVVEEYGGVLPRDLAQLERLPGVGAYLARAVAVFAFEADLGVVDTNVGRVLARAVAGRPLRRREAQELADELVPRGDGWAWNQAMLDLGALVCRRREPHCDACPWREDCRWAGRGGTDPADGSFAVGTRQAPFAGSDRQGRGRLVRAAAAAGAAGIDAGDVAGVAGWRDDPSRAERVVAGLVEEGLLAWTPDGALALPAGDLAVAVRSEGEGPRRAASSG